MAQIIALRILLLGKSRTGTILGLSLVQCYNIVHIAQLVGLVSRMYIIYKLLLLLVVLLLVVVVVTCCTTGPQEKWESIPSSAGTSTDAVLYTHTGGIVRIQTILCFVFDVFFLFVFFLSTTSLKDDVYELRVRANCGPAGVLPKDLDVS